MITKKLTSILTAAALLFGAVSFVSCGDKKAEETTAAPKTEQTVAETTEAEKKPEFVNPQTGLEADRDMSKDRPVAIMINNIDASLPQEGISKADVIYEALAEGGITRLLMVSQDYGKLGVTGSIRSSREYYLDLAANHDAIYIHAGGAESAYEAMAQRGTDHLDGVRGGGEANAAVFYRDEERLKNYALEHTMMTTGERLEKGISLSGFRTEHTGDYTPLFRFTDDEKDIDFIENKAGNICLTYNDYQQVFYKYDAKTGKYLRYQYYGQKHIDGTTGEQLAFDNLLFIGCDHGSTGDSKGHITINLIGSGSAYYVRGGRIAELRWERADHYSPMKFYNVSPGGEKEAVFLPGNFFIQIVPTPQYWAIDYQSQLNY